MHLNDKYKTTILTIEASMRTWEPVFVAIVSVDVKPTEPIHTLEFPETV